jgi:hypothetical protein
LPHLLVQGVWNSSDVLRFIPTDGVAGTAPCDAAAAALRDAEMTVRCGRGVDEMDEDDNVARGGGTGCDPEISPSPFPNSPRGDCDPKID